MKRPVRLDIESSNKFQQKMHPTQILEAQFLEKGRTESVAVAAAAAAAATKIVWY